MLTLRLDQCDPPIDRLLLVGAHADDIEIGCGGTLLRWIKALAGVSVTWVVLSADERRRVEAQASAEVLLSDVKRKEIVLAEFRDGFFPYQGAPLKEFFEELKERVAPDMIFAPHRNDLHQDHRFVSDLVWQTFRHHWILEYEIPKYDGEPSAPNAFVPLPEELCRQKAGHILRFFPSQADRAWFSEDLFLSLLRLRGLEADSPTRYAEAFHCRKLVLG